jgi:zinc protease
MSRFHLCAFALCAALPLLSVPHRALAAQSTQTAPFQPAALFSAGDISFRTLPNGVRALVKRTPGAETLSVQVWVRAGSRFETNANAGVAHLIETAALRGSKNQPADAGDEGGLAGAMRRVGGDAGALTSRDATFYSATVATPFVQSAFNALSDTVLRPDLKDSSVEEAKLSVSDDLTRRALDSVASASDLAYATAFARHPYRRSTLGSDESVAALSGAKARDYHNRQYVGANTTVVLVGDIDFERGQTLIREAFGAMPRGVRAEPKNAPDPLPKNREATRRAGLSRDAVALAWRSSGVENPRDVVALDTLLALWREGVNANLRTRLLRGGPDSTTNPPLASAYEVDFLTQHDAGLFLITLAGTVDKDAAEKAVLDEVERVRQGALSPDEIERAKSELRHQYIEQGENPAGQAGALGFYDAISSYQFAVNYLSLCGSVSGADLQRVARRYFAPGALVRVELVPLAPPQNRRDIPRQGDPNILTVSSPRR